MLHNEFATQKQFFDSLRNDTERSFLGPSMFHIVINDLGDRTRNTLIKFGGDTKLRSTESILEGRIKIQNDSDKLHLCPQKKKKKERHYPTGSCARCSLSQE